uniref:Uncharacterized protein n=1 Tax=Panagrolaimus sp. PS1159 TaxID=55785 RepID=A0AC35F5F1_9BILA
MTDSVVIADILSRCLNIEVNYKGGVFQANCDFKTMETLLADETTKLDLFCFGISIIVKSDNEGFAVSNNGAFVGDMYLANELNDNS